MRGLFFHPEDYASIAAEDEKTLSNIGVPVRSSPLVPRGQCYSFEKELNARLMLWKSMEKVLAKMKERRV